MLLQHFCIPVVGVACNHIAIFICYFISVYFSLSVFCNFFRYSITLRIPTRVNPQQWIIHNIDIEIQSISSIYVLLCKPSYYRIVESCPQVVLLCFFIKLFPCIFENIFYIFLLFSDISKYIIGITVFYFFSNITQVNYIPMLILMIIILFVVCFFLEKFISSNFPTFYFTFFVRFCNNIPIIKNISTGIPIDFFLITEAQRVIFIFDDVTIFCGDLSCSGFLIFQKLFSISSSNLPFSSNHSLKLFNLRYCLRFKNIKFHHFLYCF